MFSLGNRDLVSWRRAVSAALFLAMLGCSAAWAARPPASKLLPEKTLAVISVTDARDLARRFQNTAMGRMSRDPKLQPLVKHLYGSLADLVSQFKDQIGLSLTEILAIPQGELTFALVATEDEPPAVVLLLDTGNEIANARALLKRGTDALDRSGAKRSEETVSGITLSVYDGLGPQNRKAVLFDKDGTIVAASSAEVGKQIAAAWGGSEKSTLAGNVKFAAIMRRCRGVAGEEPQVIWFVDPIAILRAVGQGNAGVQLGLAVLPSLGLDGLMALGGSYALDAGQFDSIGHTHVLIDNPRSGILEMIALEPGDTDPEPWVPADVVTYATFHWRMERTYKSLTKVVDSFRGEGALARDMERFAEQSGIDPAKDILPSLEGRMTYFAWIERPVTPFSQGTLLAARLKDTEAVAKALEKVFQKNEKFLTKRSPGGKQYYQISPPGSDEPREGPPQPRPCFGIFDGYLIFTDRMSLYEKALATAENPEESLGKAIDFKLVAGKISRQTGSAKPAMLIFQRPEEAMRFLYELITAEGTRQGLARQAERNGFFKSIHSALEANPLPPFSVLARYLAPGGSYMLDDETGFHFTGFTLRRK